MGIRIKDRVGVRYGRLVALAYIGKDKRRNAIWHCLCDCGNFADVLGCNLHRGYTTSCGCFQKEVASTTGTNSRTHGKGGTRVYGAWVNMRDRCTNKNHKDYKYYGGRGITFCEEWKNFKNFFFDICTSRGLEDIPEGLSLDRINNDQGYFNENCRFATAIEQANNRRRRGEYVEA